MVKMQNSTFTKPNTISNPPPTPGLPVVWIYNLYRSFTVHTYISHIVERKENDQSYMMERKDVTSERIIHGIDYGNYGHEQRQCVAVLFTIPKSTWNQLLSDNRHGFLTSIAYAKGLCGGGLDSPTEIYEAAKKAFNDRKDKYGRLKRGALQISPEANNVENLLSNKLPHPDAPGDGVYFPEEKTPVQLYNGKELKEFVTRVRLESLNAGFPYDFEFYPIYSFSKEEKRDLELKHQLGEVR